jgi:site-specific DNA-methyltransferase (adenine-specific)
MFAYDMVWAKTVGSGQLNIKRRPLRTHENILVFKIGKPSYNRIFTEGEPYRISRKIKTKQCYGKQEDNIKENTGVRDTTSVWPISNPRIKGGHPTQKPVALFQKICDIYNQQNGVVLDMFCGSGTILDVVGHTTIGVEVSDEYYRLAVSRRANRVCEKTPERVSFFKNFVPNLEDCEYTIFDPKSS